MTNAIDELKDESSEDLEERIKTACLSFPGVSRDGDSGKLTFTSSYLQNEKASKRFQKAFTLETSSQKRAMALAIDKSKSQMNLPSTLAEYIESATETVKTSGKASGELLQPQPLLLDMTSLKHVDDFWYNFEEDMFAIDVKTSAFTKPQLKDLKSGDVRCFAYFVDTSKKHLRKIYGEFNIIEEIGNFLLYAKYDHIDSKAGEETADNTKRIRINRIVKYEQEGKEGLKTFYMKIRGKTLVDEATNDIMDSPADDRFTVNKKKEKVAVKDFCEKFTKKKKKTRKEMMQDSDSD